MSRIRTRSPMLRVAVALLVVGFGTLGFTGGMLSTTSAEPTVRAFLFAWQQEQYSAAARLTTGNEVAVTQALATAYRGLDAAAFYLTMGPISQRGDSAEASFRASVDIGQNGAPWDYRGHLRLRHTAAGWKVIWNPTVINPGLRRGLHLAVVSQTPQRAGLLDASGAPLLTTSTAYVVGVEPGDLADPSVTAAGLGHVTGLDPSQLLGWIRAAPEKSFQELVTLQPSQYQRLRAALARVPGLVIRKRRMRLFSSIAPAVVGSVGAESSAALRNQGIAYRPGTTVGLSGLQQAYQQTLAGTPTTEVVTETAGGRPVSVRARWGGRASAAVRTTIEAPMQRAADRALSTVPGSAAIVAVQASTGHVLAVAEQTGAGMPRIRPLAGRYPPGEAFSIVSAEAMLAGGLKITSPVRCPARGSVGGRTFVTTPPLPAQPPFWEDFAHACATALSGLSQTLTAHDISVAAQAFGLGARWRLTLPAFSGSVRPASSVAGLAADAIGQGQEQVSPLAMALVAGEVDTGVWHAPSLVPTSADAAVSHPASFSAPVLTSLRTLMRAVVYSGAAAAADISGGAQVHGQVGTAPLAGGVHGVWAHWFVGYRGGVAFAVLTFSHSAGTSAVPLAARFLATAPAG